MNTNHEDKHVRGYNRMLERVRGFMEQTEAGALPKLKQALEYARGKAVELGELTREEADRITGYLRRDIEEAAVYLGENGAELADWLRIDLLMVEHKLLDMFSQVVDETRLELDKLAMQAAISEWYTGEIAGIGVLQCSQCGEVLHFTKPGHIPPCPRCHSTIYHRKMED
ncbi:MAG: hypothetical protein A2V90_04875 [Gammaproteobacteria bacterium RBG_16_57_12]|nr:MAG: hypothetical protein A2V90_04875 [Gammaproteobacteria bacterium RBG_16_57_12]